MSINEQIMPSPKGLIVSYTDDVSGLTGSATDYDLRTAKQQALLALVRELALGIVDDERQVDVSVYSGPDRDEFNRLHLVTTAAESLTGCKANRYGWTADVAAIDALRELADSVAEKLHGGWKPVPPPVAQEEAQQITYSESGASCGAMG